MNVLNLLSELVKAIGLFVHPGVNTTLTQRIGSFLTILTLLGMLAGAVNALLPVDVPAPQNPSQDVLQDGDVYLDVPGNESAPVGILGTIAAGLSAPFGCSAAQVKAMKIAGTDALACLLSAGAKEGSIAIKQWGDGQQIDGEGLTQELVMRALPCLLSLGAATVDTYVTGSRYGGSAGERNAYTRHYSITVMPSRAK